MNTSCSRDVVLYTDNAAPVCFGNDHSESTRAHIAKKVAQLKGCRYLGRYDAKRHALAPLYFIPVDTLLTSRARALGIACANDLFGGSVAHPFMATKSITHPLIADEARTPAGWNREFTAAVATAVLDGYTAFSIEDARKAALRLLRDKPIRIKCALGIGGIGQFVARTDAELEKILTQLDRNEVEQFGVVIEQHLDRVETYSVGQVDLAGIGIAYFGTQCLTTNHRGEEVYGGSNLHIVRGTLETLLDLQMPPALRTAVVQAYRYDASAYLHLPQLIASRRNYDVAQGLDRNGVKRSGVLEQSWRIGGATPAEILAVEAMQRDPQLRTVNAATHEYYDLREPPADAIVYFHGEDTEVGALTKYCTIDSYGYFPE